MHPKQIAGAVLALLLAACSRSYAPQLASASGSSTAVYAAVVRDALGQVPDVLLVVDTTAVFEPGPVLGDTLPEGVIALAKELQKLSAHPRPSRELPLPSRVTLLPRGEALALADSGLGGTKVLEVTPIAFSPGGSEALVYYELHCGALCGTGVVVWLMRREGKWSVAERFVRWAA